MFTYENARTWSKEIAPLDVEFRQSVESLKEAKYQDCRATVEKKSTQDIETALKNTKWALWNLPKPNANTGILLVMCMAMQDVLAERYEVEYFTA